MDDLRTWGQSCHIEENIYLCYKMQTESTPIFLRYGGAEKDTSEMNQIELGEAAASIRRRAKEKAFSKGQPIIFGRNGKVFEEWPDGKIIERK